jgi:hypothetical protein
MQEEFFAAREDEIEGAAENGPGGKFETVEAKLDSVSICTLGEIVGAGTYDALFDRVFEGYRGGGSEYSRLLLVPDEVRDGLATATSLEPSPSAGTRPTRCASGRRRTFAKCLAV